MPKPEKAKLDPEQEKASAAITLSAKDVERKLTKHLGTKVKLKVKDQIKGKGTIVIEYFSYDDLDRVLDLIDK